jgi:N-acetylmuramoyl-L-alanine amidase
MLLQKHNGSRYIMAFRNTAVIIRPLPAAICIVIFLFTLGCPCKNEDSVQVMANYFDGNVIVIDPGHGGKDHGAISTSGVKEDQLNMKVAFMLSGKLKKAGAIVVMTRQSADVDDSGNSHTRKKRDMENRARLIIASNPNIVISIHMNKYPKKEYFGPQTFYHKDSPDGKRLAEDVQSQLLANLPSYKKFRIVEGDYFMLHVVKALHSCGVRFPIKRKRRKKVAGQ